jgi:hypothetical protein
LILPATYSRAFRGLRSSDKAARKPEANMNDGIRSSPPQNQNASANALHQGEYIVQNPAVAVKGRAA